MVVVKGGMECEPSEPNLMNFCWPPYQWLEFMPIVVFFLIVQVTSSALHMVHVMYVNQNSNQVSPLDHFLERAFKTYFSA